MKGPLGARGSSVGVCRLKGRLDDVVSAPAEGTELLAQLTVRRLDGDDPRPGRYRCPIRFATGGEDLGGISEDPRRASPRHRFVFELDGLQEWAVEPVGRRDCVAADERGIRGDAAQVR